MSLYWLADPNAVAAAGPRMHALIVGVGDYHHLGLGVPKPAKILSGLAPLTTTPPAAHRVAKWLESQHQNQDRPLASIELLLSPAETLERADGSKVAIEEATMPNITAAFNRWYARCDADPGNIAFFYFAGHGLNTVKQFLLPADFGDPDLPDEWEHCIDFTGMKVGMAKCKAQTQLFFVDACRDAPVAALTQRNPHGRPLVTSSVQDKVDLSAAYFAASEGRQAYGRDGEETFFCKALIMCLEGIAARKSGPRWRIDAASLSSALVSVVEMLAAVENLPLSADCQVQKPVPLHYPVGGAVLVKVYCDPDQANQEAKISVTQGAQAQVSPVGDPRPWMGRVNAGSAKIEVTFTNYPPEIVVDEMAPPTYELDVQR